MLIGLCDATSSWPSVLHDLGYQVQLIEYPVMLRTSSDTVKPDVVAVSCVLTHAIVADCKSGNNIETRQNDKYMQLEASDLHMVDISDRENLGQTVCYVDTDSNHDKLESHTSFPFITFSQDRMVGSGDFTVRQLTESLNAPISLENMREPTGYYPFSPDDSEYDVMEYVMGGLISCLSSKGPQIPIDVKSQEFMQEMVRRIYPTYKFISREHDRELRTKIKKIVSICRKTPGFDEQLQKIQEGGITTSILEKLNNICVDILEDHRTQRRINESYDNNNPNA